jgi:MFS family permease
MRRRSREPDPSTDAVSGSALVSVARPRGALRLTLDPVVGPIFLAKTLSAMGVWVHNVVAAIVMYDLTDSALLVGFVSAMQFIPQILLAPLSGAMADRGHGRSQVLAGRLVTFVGSGGLCAWIILTDDPSTTLAAGALLLAALGVGIGAVIGAAAMQSMVPTLVPPHELASAVTLNAVPPALARAAGPVLGGAVAIWWDASTAFALAAALNLLCFGIMYRCLPRDVQSEAPRARGAIRAAVRYVGRDRSILVLLVGITGVAVGSEPSITLAPEISSGIAGDTSITGLLAAAFGVGAAAAFVLVAPLQRALGRVHVSAMGLLTMALSLLCLSFSSSQVGAMAALGVCGLGMTVASTSLVTEVHIRSPKAMRGRIMALWLIAFLGSRPLASSVSGLLADTISLRVSLLATCVCVCGAAALQYLGASNDSSVRLRAVQPGDLSA